VYLALSCLRAGIPVLGFGRKIGKGLRDADVTVVLRGKVTHVEVEAWHRADFREMTDEELKAELEHRAEEKAGKKFGELPPDEQGVIAVVCVIRESDATRRLPVPPLPLPCGPSRYWMPVRLVGTAAPDEPRFMLLPL
jgi:hypothetical protein